MSKRVKDLKSIHVGVFNKGRTYKAPPNQGDLKDRETDKLLRAMRFEKSDNFEDEPDRPSVSGFRKNVMYGVSDLKKHKSAKTDDASKLSSRIHDEIENEPGFKVRPLLDLDEKDTYEDMPLHDIIEKHPFRGMLVGQSGTGKTVCLTYLINMVFSKYFDKIYVFSPNVFTDPEWKGCLLDRDNCRDEFDPEELEKLFNDAGGEIESKGRRESDKFLVIIDDKASDRQAMQHPILAKMYTQIRHRGGSILISTQSYMMVSKAARTQANLLIFFAQPNAREVETICDECAPVGMKKNEFRNMFTDITGKKHTALVRHSTRPPWEQFTENFTKPINLADYIDEKRVKRDSSLQKITQKWHDEHEKVKKNMSKYEERGLVKKVP